MKVRFKIAVIWGMILCCYFSAAQENEWSGLENAGVHTGARSSALGGANGADTEAELTDWYVNPASLNRGSWSNIALHSAFFPGDIQAFSLMGLIPLDSLWTFGAGISYNTFGENIRYDPEGNTQGVFPAFVTGFDLGASRILTDDWQIGLKMRYDWRKIDIYHSHVLRFDIGALYQLDELASFGLTIGNVGYEFVPFYKNRTSPKMDLSIYWQQKLQHLPFTLFVKMQKMNLWNRMVFDDPFDSGLNWIDEPDKEPSRAGDFVSELMRHLVLGGEFGFGMPEKVWLRFSYDHWKNQQLGIPGIRSLDGVTLGMGLHLKSFRLEYTWERIYYNVGGHQLSLSFRLLGKKEDRRSRGF